MYRAVLREHTIISASSRTLWFGLCHQATESLAHQFCGYKFAAFCPSLIKDQAFGDLKSFLIKTRTLLIKPLCAPPMRIAMDLEFE